MVVIHGTRLLWLLGFDISNTSRSLLSLRSRWQMGEERVESHLVGHLHLHLHISLLLIIFQQELVAQPNLCKGGWGKYSLDGQPLPSNKKIRVFIKKHALLCDSCLSLPQFISGDQVYIYTFFLTHRICDSQREPTQNQTQFMHPVQSPLYQVCIWLFWSGSLSTKVPLPAP